MIPTVISLGGGVQSSTLFLMATKGLIHADLAVFADTGWEPAHTYNYLEYLKNISHIPIHVVSQGNIREDMSKANVATIHREGIPPVYLRDVNNKVSMLKRQCTYKYKIRPIATFLRGLYGNRKKPSVQVMIGISMDELIRAKSSKVMWQKYLHPLLDMRMTRQDCVTWLQQNEYEVPAKSSCIGCPFQSNRQWMELRQNRPEEWVQACEADEDIRRLDFLSSTTSAFLHSSATPLRTAKLGKEDSGQISLDVCGGFCWT